MGFPFRGWRSPKVLVAPAEKRDSQYEGDAPDHGEPVIGVPSHPDCAAERGRVSRGSRVDAARACPYVATVDIPDDPKQRRGPIPSKLVHQAQDVLVDRRGVIYMSEGNSGIYVFNHNPSQ
jgi:hypothetical protein